MNFLRLIGRGDFAGADRPNRFIRDNALLHIFSGDAGEGAVELTTVDFIRNARFTFFKEFADADDRDEAGGESGANFKIDEFAGFADDVAAFTMTKNNVLATDVGEHRHFNFAGESASLFKISVLSANANVRTLEDFSNRLNIKGRGANSDINFANASGGFLETLSERFR